MQPTSNKNAKTYIDKLQSFKVNNIFAELVGDIKQIYACGSYYAVYSYGYHYPMFLYFNYSWYENSDKYSHTTSKHKNLLRPAKIDKYLTTEEMITMINDINRHLLDCYINP